MPFIDAEIGIEAVGDGHPRHSVPAHPRLQPRDIGLRCPRSVDKCRVTRVEVHEVGNLVRSQRTANAGMFWPAVHAGLEEGAIDDQLTAAVEQIKQAQFALRPIEGVRLLHRHPRHTTALGGQRITRAGKGLFLRQHLLMSRFPFLL